MDNTMTPVLDNQSTQEAVATNQASPVSNQASPVSTPATPSWKTSVRTDLRDSPLLQKFEDTPDGLNKALESHANLEKLLGHEKVPLPKDANDVEGWNRFNKALGVPDKADGYALPDASLPDNMKNITVDKGKFAEIVHAHKLTPSQAQGLWKAYQEINVQTYQQHVEEHQKQLTDTVNALKGEWGDAYNTNVELAQTVINKFSTSKDMNDKLTAQLAKDPDGIKFLAKIGEQFSENKVGDFQVKRFSLSPDEAESEIQKILRDPNHAYNNSKASDKEHDAAVEYVNSLHAAVRRAQG